MRLERKTVHYGKLVISLQNAIAELPESSPDWLSRPNDCSILYIFGCVIHLVEVTIF